MGILRKLIRTRRVTKTDMKGNKERPFLFEVQTIRTHRRVLIGHKLMFHNSSCSKDFGTVIYKLSPEEVLIGNVKDRGRIIYEISTFVISIDRLLGE